MRIATSLAASLALLALTTTAAATVTEPNGLAVPIDSSPETQLSTLFSSRGETINSQTDANTTPNAFSPLCGFTATYVLNQAGSHFGLAWYNDTGSTPLPTDLHPLVAANSTVGTTFSGTVIRSDPAYTGGLVGFALIGGETHYTNPAYDTLCSGCTPQGPWITALMYSSTVTTSAYYICFEDGSTSASSWNNDGDFNDDVYFVTGISCSGGGQPCDTGKPGICEAGLTQCAASGTTCVELNPPAQTETCNGLDDNCNGQTDEGAICPTNFVCEKGTCVAACLNGEFECTGGLVCSTDGYCVEPDCANVTCPTGQVCVAGACKAPCDGVTCPYPQVCRVGACVDPCAGVTCQTGQVCEQGICVASCACQPCTSGKVCDAASGQCVETACKAVTCAAGTHCVGGPCVDDCAGAVCPAGQACHAGTCVASGVTPDAGSAPPGLNFPTGDDGGGSGSGGDGGDGAGNGASGYGSSGASSGCGCGAAGARTQSGGAALVLALGLIVARRAASRKKKPRRAA